MPLRFCSALLNDAIVPCGLAGEGVASLSQLAGREITVQEMTPIVARGFEEVFELSLEPNEQAWPPEQIDVLTANATA